MSLENKKCVPCEGGLSPLDENQVKEYLSDLSGWQADNEGKRILKEFKFKNFVQSLEFVNKVGAIAEEEGHHPDIEFGWGYAKIKLYTHAIGGLHENDFIVATKVNKLEY